MNKKFLIPVFAGMMIFSANVQSTDAATFSEIKSSAYDYLGTPYKYGGNSTSGMDCSAFTMNVFSDVGIKLNRTTSGQYSQGESVSKSNLQTGDLVFFNTTGKGVSHVGIYIGDGKFIHASTSQGVTTTKLNDPYYWGSKYIGAKRIAGITTDQTSEVKSAAIDLSKYTTRAEVAKQIAITLKLDTNITTDSFSDVKASSEYAGYIAAVEKAGIFSGDNGKFKPNSPLTRAQMAKVLVEAFDLTGTGNGETFTDVKKSHWAYEYINILSENKVTVGKGDGRYALNDYVTPKHLNAFIDRLSR